MKQLLVSGLPVIVLMFKGLIGYGIGSAFKVVVISQTTSVTTAYVVTVKTHVTTFLTVTADSAGTQSLFSTTG